MNDDFRVVMLLMIIGIVTVFTGIVLSLEWYSIGGFALITVGLFKGATQ